MRPVRVKTILRLASRRYESWLYIDVEKRAFNVATNEPEGEPVKNREWFGMIPIMVQSTRCRLKELDDKGKTRNGECVFDQVSWTR
jgi:hypothetical protein